MKRTISFICLVALLGWAKAQDGARSFTLVNKCSYPVWYGFAGGGSTAKGSTSTICNSDDDCY